MNWERLSKYSCYADDFDADEVLRQITSGALIEGPEYYGTINAWKADDGKFYGILLQYRNVTEDHTFDSATELVNWIGEILPLIA